MAKPVALIGSSSIFLDAVERASAAAPLNRPVLVIGERGTGKELIAERLHRLSSRWGGPLVSLNCAALPENLIDAELFGYEAGAFTGAQRARAGRFEDADGGTLFLDEIATLSPAAQERLLRVVEYGELTRIGSNRAIAVDVRLVGATNEDLPGLVDKGRFRADLLDRLSLRSRHPAAAARTRRGHRGAGAAFRPPHGRRTRLGRLSGLHRQGAGAAQRPPLAGQCPRTEERRRTLALSLGRCRRARRPHHPRPVRITLAATSSPLGAPISVTAQKPSIDPISEAAALPSPALASVSDFRAAVHAYERQILMAALERCRHNQRRTAAALALSYDQLRHALKRHDLLTAE